MDKKDFKDIAAEAVKEVYEDAIQPVAEETGGLLALLPRTIKACLCSVEKWILNKEYSVKETQRLLEIKLASISPDKIGIPESFIAVPAINALSYTLSSDELLDMYANLLATSMIKDSKWEVHPSFVEIIKQLSPDEAKLLKKISSHNGENEFPLINLSMRKINDGSSDFEAEHYVKISHFTNLGDDVCERPEKIMMYIDNLLRLQLIEVVDNEVVSDFDYQEIIDHEYIEEYKKTNKLYCGFAWETKSYLFKISQLGSDFIDVCVTGSKIH